MKQSLLFVILFSFSRLFSQDSITSEIKRLEELLKETKKQEQKTASRLEDYRLKGVLNNLKAMGLPKTSSDDVVIYHSAMALCYDEKCEQAKWVAHIITTGVIEGNASRSNDFREDSLVKTGSAVKADYWYSGFDRGHLAPSADFRWSKKALSESYFYSNMSPMKAELNRERWAELEDFVRQYVVENKRPLYVVTGGVLNNLEETIGVNKVCVPVYFYKVVLDYEGSEKMGIGFIMKNDYCKYPVTSYAVSIDSVEKMTGIDFFPALPDNEEVTIEAGCDPKKWHSGKSKGEETPLAMGTLPKGAFNTIEAKSQVGNKVTVCGTVVAGKFSEKSGATFLNLDKKFPNQVFSINIWKDNRVNFSYKPEVELLNKQICVTGKVEDNKGTPCMAAEHEKDIEVMDDEP